MLRSLLAVAFLLPATALAGGYADWTKVEEEYPGWPDPEWFNYVAQGHHVFDLLTVTDDGDRWEAAHALAYFEGDPACDYTFWDHPLNGDLPPNPVLFSPYWLLQYDSSGPVRKTGRIPNSAA